MFCNPYYTGSAENLHTRTKEHNLGKCIPTSKDAPWKIGITMAFANQKKAIESEKYSKTSSGRAFTKKPFQTFFQGR
jgi:putative endonuclease